MGNLKEHIVVGSLTKLEVLPELRWGMEDDVFVGGIGKKELKLFLPAFGLGDPAGGAESRFAGMEDFFLRLAIEAFPQMEAHCPGTAHEHFANVFGNRRTFKKRSVFLRNIWPVVGKELFELFASYDLHGQGRYYPSPFWKNQARQISR
jgi:hypothetical protein